MQLKLLVVLEAGASAKRVGEYVARACGGAFDADFKVVLFIEPPGLPTWLESGDSHDVVTQRRQYETEARERTNQTLAEVHRHLLEKNVSDEAITEEVAEACDQAVPDILNAARRHGCDTIVIARHHKSMLREFFEGDSEEKLVRHPTGFTIWLVE